MAYDGSSEMTPNPQSAFAATSNARSSTAMGCELYNWHPAQAPFNPARPGRPVIARMTGKMPSVKETEAPENVYYLHGLAHVKLNAIDLCF